MTYQIEGLRPFRSYEVKVSYPASLPASFKIQLEEPGVGQARKLRGSRRRVLDTEKITFSMDEDGNLKGASDSNALNNLPLVTVSVQQTGILSPSLGGKRASDVTFNIECEELKMGIPLKAWRVGGVAMVLVLVLLVGVNTWPAWVPSRNMWRRSFRSLRGRSHTGREFPP
eukprot:TRINITY_DN18814_c0_g1_i2.p1 TRINITY_DN18814_c0_g1~~TRINITY_DN18814_c0_g1_i2.p1  ORF type:complete len:171 (-),score=11.86 TRINITY_DN18814_c0_g1_i2:171-683(-)